MNNSAFFGGDGMYGASFNSPFCQVEGDAQQCNVSLVGASSNELYRHSKCHQWAHPLC